MLVVKRMTVEMEFIHARPNYFIGVFSIGMDVKKKWGTFIRWPTVRMISSKGGGNPFVSNDGCTTLG
jgi:hypothetical protein